MGRIHQVGSIFTSSELLTRDRWFALIRTWTPWLAPRQGKSHFELDKDGLLCSFLNDKGKHVVLLAFSGINNVSALFQSDSASGKVIVHVRWTTYYLATLTDSLGTQ